MNRSGGPPSRRQASPGAPWHALTDQGSGYLSYYYSEPLARWPVRHITRPRDNKSDPNIETGTYGLFSTCEPHMRNRIVKDGRATVFFLTQRKPQTRRVLTGYYHVGWFTQGTYGAANNDYALAAETVRFFAPISTDDLRADLRALCGARFRTYKQIDTAQTSALREFCDSQPDQTARYIQEVARVERFARAPIRFCLSLMGSREWLLLARRHRLLPGRLQSLEGGKQFANQEVALQ